MTGLKTAARLVSLVMLVAAHPVEYSDYAGQFDRFEARTRTVPPDARVAMFRELFRNLRPGLYTSSDPQRLNHRILRSLQEFPQLQPAYRSVVPAIWAGPVEVGRPVQDRVSGFFPAAADHPGA